MTNTWSILPNPTQAGQVGGHEGVGKVVAFGPGAEGVVGNVKLGDRVGIKWIAGACGGCPACLEGHDGVCFNQKISGYYTPGTFQQYVTGPANYVTPIPDGLDSATAAPMLCGGVTVYAGMKKSGAAAGQWVAIIGAGGGLGHIACQIGSRGMGFRIIGIDHSSKKQLALDSGAEHFFGFDTEKDVAEAVKGVTGGLGVKAAVVVTASNAAYNMAMPMIRFGGSLVCIGIPEGDPVAIAGVDAGKLIIQEKRVIGSAVGNRRDAIECLDMAARGVVKMHYRTEPMSKLTSIFEEMHQGKLMGRVVLDLTKE